MTILGATSPPRFPIGESDYRDLRRHGFTYVDKTIWAADILGHSAKVHLVPRPRRFGKTLNMSMLRYFVERCEEDRSDLFADTAIWTAAEGRYREHFQRYPVIYLSFKDIKTADWSSCQAQLIRLLARTARELLRYSPLREGGSGTPSSGELTMDRLALETTSIGVFSDMLLDASTWLHKVTGERTIILIDEYDAPLHSAWQHGYWDKAVEFFRNFLSAGLKDNNHIYKGVLTGAFSIPLADIFGGFDNAVERTLLDTSMSRRFGLLEVEVSELCEVARLPNLMPELRRQSGGHFAGQNPPIQLYNPGSVMLRLGNPEAARSFGRETMIENATVASALVSHTASLGTTLAALLNGGTINHVVVKGCVSFPDIRRSAREVVGLLFHSGYLAAVNMEYANNCLSVTLQIPNEEIRGSIAEMLVN